LFISFLLASTRAVRLKTSCAVMYLLTTRHTALLLCALSAINSAQALDNECKNVKGRFRFGSKKEKNCKQIHKNFKNLCETNRRVQKNCPITCDLCDLPPPEPDKCSDSDKDFLVGSITRSCNQVKRKFIHLCEKKNEVRSACPLTCGQCV